MAIRLRRAVAIAACLAAAVAAALLLVSPPPDPDATEASRDPGPVADALPDAIAEDPGAADVSPGLEAPAADPGGPLRLRVRPPALGFRRRGTIVFVEIAREGATSPLVVVLPSTTPGGSQEPRKTGWPGVTIETEGDAAPDGSLVVVVRGLPRGRYRTFVRSQGEKGERGYAAPGKVVLGESGGASEADLGSATGTATALVVAKRAGAGLHQSWLTVRAGPFRVFSSPIGPGEASIPVPAATDLAFALSWFAGKEELGDVEPIRAVIPAGTKAPIVFDVPAGLPVRVAARTPEGSGVRVERLDLWALDPEGEAPRWLDAEAVFGWGEKGLTRDGRLAPGRYRVGVTPQGSFGCATALLAVAADGETALDVPVPAATDLLHLRLRRAGANSWPRSLLRLTSIGGAVEQARRVTREFSGLGVVDLPSLPPGPYDLWIAPEGSLAGTLRVEVPDAPGAVLDVVWVEPTAGTGQVACRVETPDGNPVRNCDVFLERDGETCARVAATPTGSIFRGTAEFRRLPPGRYRLRVPPSWFHAPTGHPEHAEDVVVTERGTASVKVVLRAP